MKRIGQLWPRIIQLDNLWLAYHKARLGKQHRPEVAQFSFDLEAELIQLQQDLANGQYRPGPYRQFWICDRKPRLISAAPFRDRVAQHAVMNWLEPELDKRMIFHSYACRKNKGVHKAVDYYQRCARRYAYVLTLDIRRYFPSLDHAVMLEQLARVIKDRPLLNWLTVLVETSPHSINTSGHASDGRPTGLPIGNLVSQYLGNWYLNELDHWLIQQPGVAYLRYVDDLMLFADSKQQLWQLRDQIEHRLSDIYLNLHTHKQQLYPSRCKATILGYQIARHKRWLANDNGYRFGRRDRKQAALFKEGKLDWHDWQQSHASWLGHVSHAEADGLKSSIGMVAGHIRGFNKVLATD